MKGYVLARLNGVKLEDLKYALKADALHHVKEGLCLEHIWQNTDNPDEVLFLFRTDDLVHAQKCQPPQVTARLDIASARYRPVACTTRLYSYSSKEV